MIKAKYNGHNEDRRTVGIRLPDGKRISVDWPDHVKKSDSFNMGQTN